MTECKRIRYNKKETEKEVGGGGDRGKEREEIMKEKGEERENENKRMRRRGGESEEEEEEEEEGMERMSGLYHVQRPTPPNEKTAAAPTLKAHSVPAPQNDTSDDLPRRKRGRLCPAGRAAAAASDLACSVRTAPTEPVSVPRPIDPADGVASWSSTEANVWV